MDGPATRSENVYVVYRQTIWFILLIQTSSGDTCGAHWRTAMTDRSLPALMIFLEYLGSKGLMPRNTVGGRKAAVSKMLGVLDPEETGDVTALDLNQVMTRFVNIEGKNYTPDSLTVYRSRVNASINDFKAYLNNPASFKAGGSTKKPKPENGKKTSPSKAQSMPRAPDTAQRFESAHSMSANVFPVPIRPDVVVRIHGLPFDLTVAEADKIANVVRAMAMT